MNANDVSWSTGGEVMNIVFAGHVDHGKSTIIGRLLADTDSLPEGKLEQVKESCLRNAKPFEYSLLVDALKDEQAQGITIDTGRVFLKTEQRQYIIIDTPGHIEFLKNMVTGASRAESAFLVIDASEGVRENTRRHGYMISMLGIAQVVVLVNKMDLIQYSQGIYDSIVSEYASFLNQIGIQPLCFIPVSGIKGDNIVKGSNNMPWYRSSTVLEVIDRFDKEKPAVDKPFRLPIQDVYRFTEWGDKRTIIAGTVESGSLSIGEEVIFYPSGKKSRVKTIEVFNSPGRETITAGYPAGFTLEDQVYLERGEIASSLGEPPPRIATRFLALLFWMGKKPLARGKNYLLKLGTSRTQMQVEEIRRVINAADLSIDEQKDFIERHETAECIIKTIKPIAFDIAEEIPATGRFVIVEQYEICGGGTIREELQDRQP